MSDTDPAGDKIVACRARGEHPCDHEKCPTSPYDAVVCRGVRLESRYRKAHDLHTMELALHWVHETDGETPIAPLVRSVFCNSEAFYMIELVDGAGHMAEVVAEVFSRAFLVVSDGYNGLVVDCEGAYPYAAYRDPCWRGERPWESAATKEGD